MHLGTARLQRLARRQKRADGAVGMPTRNFKRRKPQHGGRQDQAREYPKPPRVIPISQNTFAFVCIPSLVWHREPMDSIFALLEDHQPGLEALEVDENSRLCDTHFLQSLRGSP
jgi:hypothetical protein